MISILRVRHLTLLMAFVALFVLAGCGDDGPTNPDDGNNNNDQTDGSISCNVDGASWSYDLNAAGIEHSIGWLTLTSGTSDATDVAIITVPASEGAYDLGQTGETNISLTINGIPYMTGGQTGTLTVTNIDGDHAEGTFSGTAIHAINMTDTVVITNGTFDVPVVYLP